MTANAHTYPNGSAAREVFADTMAEAVDEIKTVGTREAICVFVGLYQYRVVEGDVFGPGTIGLVETYSGMRIPPYSF